MWSGYVLDTRSISGFGSGAYEVWNVRGNVTITLTSTAGHWVPSAASSSDNGDFGRESVYAYYLI